MTDPHRPPPLVFVVFGLLTPVILFLIFRYPMQQARMDREVDRLCAIDGGVKVFETVEVPPEYLPDQGEIFPQYARLRWEDTLGPDYVRRHSVTSIEGHPLLTRFEDRIVRRVDGKVLGRKVRYMRKGGDLVAPGLIGPDSTYVCPAVGKGGDLGRSVFVKGGSEK